MNALKRRIEVSNEILDTFVPGVVLYWKKNFLRMSWDNRKKKALYDFPAHLRSDGSWPRYGYHNRPTGGTGFQALAQIIRFTRDLSRLPIFTWEYWASEKVKLGNEKTLRLLRESDYGNPLKPCCILCGSIKFEKRIDWWSLDGKIGPSCYMGRCVKNV